MLVQVFVVLSQFVRLTDRQTDERTDSFLVAIPYVALHTVAWWHCNVHQKHLWKVRRTKTISWSPAFT